MAYLVAGGANVFKSGSKGIRQNLVSPDCWYPALPGCGGNGRDMSQALILTYEKHPDPECSWRPRYRGGIRAVAPALWPAAIPRLRGIMKTDHLIGLQLLALGALAAQNPLTTAATQRYFNIVRRNLEASADAMPADKYCFQADCGTNEFAEWLIHSTQRNYSDCATLKGVACSRCREAGGRPEGQGRSQQGIEGFVRLLRGSLAGHGRSEGDRFSAGQHRLPSPGGA